MRMDFYAGNMTQFFVFRKKWISLLHCDSKCSLWSWRVSVGPPLCALPAVCLVSVCPHGSLDCCCLHPVHCPCFCVRHWARLHWLLRRSVCGATLFWLLASTDDACWQCFCVLDALGLSSLCLYCSCVSSLLAHLAICFLCSLLSTPTPRDSSPSLPMFPLSSQHFVCFFHFLCHQDNLL